MDMTMTIEQERISVNKVTPLTVTAADVLRQGAAHIEDRAAQRDCPTGERSMAATVTAFNAIYQTNLTETQGWQFMSILKKVRGNQGIYVPDDHEDDVAYAALAAESAARNAQ